MSEKTNFIHITNRLTQDPEASLVHLMLENAELRGLVGDLYEVISSEGMAENKDTQTHANG